MKRKHVIVVEITTNEKIAEKKAAVIIERALDIVDRDKILEHGFSKTLEVQKFSVKMGSRVKQAFKNKIMKYIKSTSSTKQLT